MMASPPALLWLMLAAGQAAPDAADRALAQFMAKAPQRTILLNQPAGQVETCLTQMIAAPLVRATGGLSITVAAIASGAAGSGIVQAIRLLPLGAEASQATLYAPSPPQLDHLARKLAACR